MLRGLGAIEAPRMEGLRGLDAGVETPAYLF